MRAVIWIACSLVLAGGCTKKVETPSGTLEAPKEVQGIGAGTGKGGGLPQPPDLPAK